MSENKFQDRPIKLCPFRKVVYAYYYQSAAHPKLSTSMKCAEWTEEEFMPCLKEKCQAWHTTTYDYSYCGLAF